MGLFFVELKGIEPSASRVRFLRAVGFHGRISGNQAGQSFTGVPPGKRKPRSGANLRRETDQVSARSA
jgi:hypothetical protein